MPLQFIPRDRQFWFYHGSSTLFTGAISLLTVYLWSNIEAIYLVSTLAWILPYTAAVLGFRWIYNKREWHMLPMSRLIPIAIAYGTLAGLLVVAVVQAIVLPVFWQEVVTGHASANVPLIPHEYVIRRIVGDGLQGQLFIAAWIFIYITVTSSRRIKQGALANLHLQDSLKEAQLSSLSNQLNPHFLFNALNNIRFMIHENRDHADDMLVALSEMLRYSLESSRQEKVRLSEELGIINQYVSIMKSQLETRLRFDMRIPASLHACLIPPMVLQMLIENAIKHGIDQLQHGGDLVVEASEAGERLILVVSNDMAANPAKADGMGIGLHNIQRRLQLLYGTDAALEVTRGGSRFKVVLSLPKEVMP